MPVLSSTDRFGGLLRRAASADGPVQMRVTQVVCGASRDKPPGMGMKKGVSDLQIIMDLVLTVDGFSTSFCDGKTSHLALSVLGLGLQSTLRRS